MNIKVKGCQHCPFYNYISSGNMADRGECMLAWNVDAEGVDYIDVPWDRCIPKETPAWCPLRAESATVELEG